MRNRKFISYLFRHFPLNVTPSKNVNLNSEVGKYSDGANAACNI